MRLVSSLAAFLFGGVTAARNYLFDSGMLRSVHADCPVISVGNITVGGNGKTPLVMAVALGLRARGYRPFVVTRGYGGSERGPTLVTETSTSETVGDEPILISQHTGCPVVVARRRSDGVRFALQKGLGDVAILDDGFQHRWLKRDVDLVCIACGTDNEVQAFVAGDMLPLGRFREHRGSALRRAHGVVLMNRSGDRAGLELRTNLIGEHLPKSLPQYIAHVVVRGVRNVTSGALVSLNEAVVVSAIAQPESFLTAVKAAGIHVRSHFAFPDHHHFSLEEVEALSSHAPEVPLLCTSKDAVKLRSLCSSRLHVLETSLEFDSEDSFFRALVAAIEKRRARVF